MRIVAPVLNNIVLTQVYSNIQVIMLQDEYGSMHELVVMLPVVIPNDDILTQ